MCEFDSWWSSRSSVTRANPKVPLIQHLSNRRFHDRVLTLLKMLDEPAADKASLAPVRIACRCGCGGGAALGRKFVNQAHYDAWKSATYRAYRA
jgi:hypothetical protein